MSCNHLAAKPVSNGIRIKAGKADDDKLARRATLFTCKIAIYTPADSLHHVRQHLAIHHHTALGPQNPEFRCHVRDALLKQIGIRNPVQRNYIGGEFIMAMLMMMVVSVPVFVVMIICVIMVVIMVIMMVHML